MKINSLANVQQVHAYVKAFLCEQERITRVTHKQHRCFDADGLVGFDQDTFLSQHLERIQITELDEEQIEIVVSGHKFYIHVFRLNSESPSSELLDDHERGQVTSCEQLLLPSLMLDGCWETLLYEKDLKQSLIDYATTAMLFSDRKVNPNLISWNRVMLLHGPPGTGKTSLCKALAQKLSIRLSHRYASTYLLEINAHSLFSKWFSESGKLVMKLFDQVKQLVEDGISLICILIDEVESLSAARKAAISGSEPSDAIRVVNALLTQIDSLKRYPNVLLLTTSNLTECIDEAFIDRADMKCYIGLPTVRSRYEILISCINELLRVQLIDPCEEEIAPYRRVSHDNKSGLDDSAMDFDDQSLAKGEKFTVSKALLLVAEQAEGFSGRALRKLPFQAHALFVQNSTVPLYDFMLLLQQAIAEEALQKQQLFPQT